MIANISKKNESHKIQKSIQIGPPPQYPPPHGTPIHYSKIVSPSPQNIPMPPQKWMK